MACVQVCLSRPGASSVLNGIREGGLGGQWQMQQERTAACKSHAALTGTRERLFPSLIREPRANRNAFYILSEKNLSSLLGVSSMIQLQPPCLRRWSLTMARIYDRFYRTIPARSIPAGDVRPEGNPFWGYQVIRILPYSQVIQ